MKITGMEQFQNVCRRKFIESMNKIIVDECGNVYEPIEFMDVYVVWACKTLQNYKCVISTNVNSFPVLAEYTYNGDKEELYEDIYKKISNRCIIKE